MPGDYRLPEQEAGELLRIELSTVDAVVFRMQLNRENSKACRSLLPAYRNGRKDWKTKGFRVSGQVPGLSPTGCSVVEFNFPFSKTL